MAWPVDMTNDVTLNQFRPYEDSDETHYWIDIHGVRVPLTKSQFIAMHDARIQLWDKAKWHTEQHIIKKLEVLWQKTQGTDIPAVVVLPEAIALIKGENK
jgi:hypothetical protein